MRLKKVIIERFRSYRQRTELNVSELTALVGRNDIGKSTLLEALEVFFNNDQVKIDQGDACVHCDDKTVLIGCVFDDLPESVVIDAEARTSLREEYLLNADGDLEIHKKFNCAQKSCKEAVFAIAHHPTTDGVNDLLRLKQSELRSRIKERQIEANRGSNVAMRGALWQAAPDLSLASQEIPLDSGDAKNIWDQMRKELPLYALFRADRPSQDKDSEVQDPLKFAVAEAVREIANELQVVEDAVRQRVEDVAQRTLQKLQEFSPDLAQALAPQFDEMKWPGIFKVSLSGDDGIPINKRGSGVRRLILLSFFRAEAERRKAAGCAGIIYAIEEPETSQHPSNQRMLVRAFRELSEGEGCQVILTTHVPGLAEMLPVDSIRHLTRDDQGNHQIGEGAQVLESVASELGILPDHGVQALVCVEGPNDIDFLIRLSALLHADDPAIPDLARDRRIALVPLGGDSLKRWVNQHYLRQLQLREFHLYDNEPDKADGHREACATLAARGNGSWGTLTTKRTLENYLHPDAIREELGVQIEITDDADVAALVADAMRQANLARPLNAKNAKKRLNTSALERMTIARFAESDPDGELRAFLARVGQVLAFNE